MDGAVRDNEELWFTGFQAKSATIVNSPEVFMFRMAAREIDYSKWYAWDQDYTGTYKMLDVRVATALGANIFNAIPLITDANGYDTLGILGIIFSASTGWVQTRKLDLGANSRPSRRFDFACIANCASLVFFWQDFTHYSWHMVVTDSSMTGINKSYSTSPNFFAETETANTWNNSY